MINLLPPEEKEILILEKRKKIIIILGIMILIPLICFILFLTSIWLYILAEVNTQKIVLQQAQKQYQTASFLHFKGIIQQDNSILNQLNSFYKKEIDINGALQEIASLSRPKNVYMTDLYMTRQDNQKIIATISGISSSRNDLLIFKKTVEADKRIKNPSFSPESWIASENVAFNLTFEVSQ